MILGMKSATYKVRLSRRDKILLYDIINKGVHSSRQIRRAQILLDLDNLSHYANNRKYRPTHQSIANRNDVSVTTVQAICKQFVEEGLEATLNRKKRETPPIAPKVTGDIEARIVALACGTPPDGYSRWTLRLLENKVVELGIADSLSDTTIRRVLKKQNLSLI
jgi:transposase